jgi:aspartate/methionine/tyrosine aminotransferase
MHLQAFKLERYFAEYEFKVKYLLSPSDCESLSMQELLRMASPESLELWQGLKLGYTESAGNSLLRTEVAELYRGIPPEQVMIAAPEEAIFLAMQTLLAPGDHLVAIYPAYQSLYEIARSIGCQLTPWTFELRDGTWRLDLDQLEDSLTPRTRLLVINFPHNPTGYLPSREELETILQLAREKGIYVFSDEMYRLLEYDEDMRSPPVCDLYEKGISLSGLSKAFALPGLRMGWLATQERGLIESWLRYKDYTTICNSAPSEILGIIALRAKDLILIRNLDIIRENLSIAERFFSQHEEQFSWVRPMAGSVAFPRWLGRERVELFCQQVLDRQGVMIVPGSIFDFPGNHFRIGLGRKNFAEALGRLGDPLSLRKD